MLRVRLSRWLSRWLLGREGMVCAWASWFRWPIRHALNALFCDRRHCDAMADWEARQEREGDALDDWRGQGWL